MDGILALCHFCESHGPCVILCTQHMIDEPQQSPHNLTVPWCEACQSINVKQALVSRRGNLCFVTTRSPKQQDLSFLLKQAAVRSLSCEEETSKDGGTLYFGDNERGHVISHTFALRDSLARGFYRKYSILILMKDKIHLLNTWTTVVSHFKSLSRDLQSRADIVNEVEQEQYSQRAVRQAQSSPRNATRSLSQLTAQPAVFGHVHLWFTWILSLQEVVEKPNFSIPRPISRSPSDIRQFSHHLNDVVFQTICYCVITGCHLISDESNVISAFHILLPQQWIPSIDAAVCRIKKGADWVIEWPGILPNRLPTLLTNAEKAIKHQNLPLSALEPFLNGMVLKWYHISQALLWSGGISNKELRKSLEVHDHDLVVVNYWMYQCSKAQSLSRSS